MSERIGFYICHCGINIAYRVRVEEVAAYVATGDPFDKAGAYAIQHEGFHPVEGFAHCFANVMGLPLETVRNMLSRCR